MKLVGHTVSARELGLSETQDGGGGGGGEGHHIDNHCGHCNNDNGSDGTYDNNDLQTKMTMLVGFLAKHVLAMATNDICMAACGLG